MYGDSLDYASMVSSLAFSSSLSDPAWTSSSGCRVRKRIFSRIGDNPQQILVPGFLEAQQWDRTLAFRLEGRA